MYLAGFQIIVFITTIIAIINVNSAYIGDYFSN